MAGIENLRKVIKAGVDIANAEETLRATDWKAVGQEALDADEAELKVIADDIKGLALIDKALEAAIEAAVEQNAPIAAFVLKLIKTLFPAKP